MDETGLNECFKKDAWMNIWMDIYLFYLFNNVLNTLLLLFNAALNIFING